MALFSDELFNVFEEQPESDGSKGKKRRREHKGKGDDQLGELKKQKLVEAPGPVSSPAGGATPVRDGSDDQGKGEDGKDTQEQEEV